VRAVPLLEGLDLVVAEVHVERRYGVGEMAGLVGPTMGAVTTGFSRRVYFRRARPTISSQLP
jgi:hypothetical protein